MNERTILTEPEPIKIDALKTAVIVVDMQNAFLPAGRQGERVRVRGGSFNSSLFPNRVAF
jgi:hypothetical protein